MENADRQLLLIRHGQTEWSKAGRHTGLTDISLTDRGRQEALDAGKTLAGWNLSKAYCSPLVRARETAEIVSPDCGITIEDTLVEWDYGDYEGITTPDVREEIPGWSVWTHEIIGGETYDAVGARADEALARIEDECPDSNAVVFAHGHYLAIMIARWCGLPAIEGRRFALATATVSLLGHHREDRVIRALNHQVGEVLDAPSRT